MPLVDTFQELATNERAIQDIREIVVNDLFQQNTSDFFTIVPGIKGGQQVAAMKGFEYITVASQGCGGSGVSPEFPAFSQSWNPKLQEVKINYCYTDFMNHFTQWKLANGADIKDLSQSEELSAFIQDLVIKAMSLDLQRIVLLGDKDILTQDVLTDEAGKGKFYNTIDKGLIPTLMYLKTLPEFTNNFVDLDKNTGAMTDQLKLDPEYALGVYEEVVDTYDFDGDILLSSNRLFKNYTSWLKRANGYGVQGNIDSTVKGLGDVTIDGERISPIVNYDRWKNTDFVTGEPASIHLPHFALFSRKEYLQVGVDSEAALQDLRLEYIGGEDETFWIKANYMLDFKLVNPYAIKAAI